MATNIERSRSLQRNRFGHLSKNMFFARHVAQPRYLKFIMGNKTKKNTKIKHYDH